MLVSVIIPSYNRGRTISKSIESVLKQTYVNLELIIVDDGSTDNTREVVEAISDKRIKYLYQSNQGACAARNHGVDVARGEYIAFQDSDDEWLPEKLEKQMHIMETYDDVDIVCCKTICERLDGTCFKSLENRSEGIISVNVGPYGIPTQTWLVRKKVFEKVKFDTNVTRYQDLDFLLCAIKYFKIYCVPEYLVKRYHESDSISNHPERIYDMTVYFQKKHAVVMEDKNQLLSYFLSSMLIETAIDLRTEDKSKYYKKALEVNHSVKILIKLLMSLFGIKVHK